MLAFRRTRRCFQQVAGEDVVPLVVRRAPGSAPVQGVVALRPSTAPIGDGQKLSLLPPAAAVEVVGRARVVPVIRRGGGPLRHYIGGASARQRVRAKRIGSCCLKRIPPGEAVLGAQSHPTAAR